MRIAIERQEFTMARVIRRWWDVHWSWMLRASIVILTLFAVGKMGDEFRRLLFQTDPIGPIDLDNFQRMVSAWFEGKPFYSSLYIAVYPPASLLLLWPLVGWLDFSNARWLLAILFVPALGGLVWLIIRASYAESRLEIGLAALMLLGMNATGVTIGNGQLVLFVLLLMLIALMLLKSNPHDIRIQFLGSGLILWALVKPSITIPFLWFLLFIPTLRPILIIAIGYIALTLAAATFQGFDLWNLFSEWLTRATAAGADLGYANITMWSANLGLASWGFAVSVTLLAILGVWIYRHREKDRWLLMGVTGVFARLWVFHSVYDDVLIVLPMVALFRIAKRATENTHSIAAGLLLATTITVMLFPARWQLLPAPWNWIFIGGHPLVWIADLVFLIAYAQREQNSAAASRQPAC